MIAFNTLMKKLKTENETELFALKKRKDTEEHHLFFNQKNDAGECRTKGDKSICKKMTRAEASSSIFTCYTPSEARRKCAEIGRPVCGTCVSHLYASYD